MEKYTLRLENKNGDWRVLDTKGRIPSKGEIIYLYIDEKDFSKLAYLNRNLRSQDEIEDFKKRFNNKDYEVKEIHSESKFLGKNLDFKISSVIAKAI